MGKAIWRRVAEEDLEEAYLYLGTDAPDVAERFLDAVENTMERLLRHPGMGRVRDFQSPRARGVRSWPVRGFPRYLLFYRTE